MASRRKLEQPGNTQVANGARESGTAELDAPRPNTPHSKERVKLSCNSLRDLPDRHTQTEHRSDQKNRIEADDLPRHRLLVSHSYINVWRLSFALTGLG